MNCDKKLNSNLTKNIYDNCYLIKIILHYFNLTSYFEIVITPIDKISIVYFKLKYLHVNGMILMLLCNFMEYVCIR